MLSNAGLWKMAGIIRRVDLLMSRFEADALQMSASIYPKVCQVVF